MNDTHPIGLPAAASRLGVSLRTLRKAIRAGAIAAPAKLTATSALPAGWLTEAKATLAASPNALRRNPHTKVPPFARYPGTSAWRDDPNRVREYYRFLATQ